MAYINKTGKCRRQLHVLDEVGRTKAGACKACCTAKEKARWPKRDYSNRNQTKTSRPKPVIPSPIWTPSPEPYVPGHAVTISEKLRTGRCGCGERWTGTREQIKTQHLTHINSILRAK